MFRPDASRFQPSPPSPQADALMPTRAAATYCGYSNPSSLRKACFDGKVVPAGRRGGTGTLMWRRSDLDAFLLGQRLRGTRQGPRRAGATRR
jgi:hypothetical protein